MKPLEDIVVSLPMAEDLLKAGWPQGTTCCYWRQLGDLPPDLCTYMRGVFEAGGGFTEHDAPTLGEIVQRLPTTVEIPAVMNGKARECFLRLTKDSCDYVWYDYESIDGACQTEIAESVFGDTLVNSCAKMWIFLAENDLLPKSDEAA